MINRIFFKYENAGYPAKPPLNTPALLSLNTGRASASNRIARNAKNLNWWNLKEKILVGEEGIPVSDLTRDATKGGGIATTNVQRLGSVKNCPYKYMAYSI